MGSRGYASPDRIDQPAGAAGARVSDMPWLVARAHKTRLYLASTGFFVQAGGSMWWVERSFSLQMNSIIS